MLCVDECGSDYHFEVGAMSLDQNWPNWFDDKPAKCSGKYGPDPMSKGVRLCCKLQSNGKLTIAKRTLEIYNQKMKSKKEKSNRTRRRPLV
eukprot:TRINITY_DN6805_c0_g1_i1.p1 TRINITY_DN6805_c0_g1~~TRINITY_DN6805_c0_g1_i1.p1  ORF type:complete len:91 (+),score=13.95 TRINITY_DN6805_c0_g1_i1:233-505(+)